MDVSIGVMAFNEEKNISNLLNNLLKQKTKEINIKEIIVVNDGSTDKTNELVSNFKNKKIILLKQKSREGKFQAINYFIKSATSSILVLESADTIPEQDAIEKLCILFQKINVGIISSRIVPTNKKNKLFGRINHLLYDIHHLVSSKKPKFGEMIAFRKIMDKIPKTAVDEEEIANIIMKRGFMPYYEKNAIVYNKGPENLKDFITQRRRVYCGHLELRKRTRYEPITLNNFTLIGIVLTYCIKTPEKIPIVAITCVVELYSRFLGFIDFITKKDHSIWKISHSTKKII